MSDTKVKYRFDGKSKGRQHVLAVTMPRVAVAEMADTIAADVSAYAQSRGYALFAEDIWSLEAAAVSFSTQHYGPWLIQHIGQEDTDWSMYTMEEDGLWAFIDFERKADAMLFKLTFDNQ